MLLLERLAKRHTTSEAHEWISRLVNLVCKPDLQNMLDRQGNLPEGTYEVSEFMTSIKL